MNKQDLIKAVSEGAELTKAQAESAINAYSNAVIEELQHGSGEVTLPDLGKLKTAKRAARIGRNPQTGEAVKIAAKTVVKFSAAKSLKDAVA